MNLAAASPDLLFQRALAVQQQGRIVEARELYRQLLTLQPENPGAVFMFGLCHHLQGDHDSALALMDIALAMNPAMAQAHYNRAKVLQDIGRFAEAVAGYDEAIGLRPDHAQAHNNRGNALRRLERLPEALASFDRAVDLAPDFAEAHTNRGNALLALHRPEEALAAHQRALELRPDLAQAHCNRGAALQALGRPDEALASVDRALDLDPQYREAMLNRGEILVALGRKDQALASYDRAIALASDDARAYELRGHLFMAARRYQEAQQDFRRALELDPAQTGARAQLAHASMLLCDWQGLDSLLAEVRRAIDAGRPAGDPFAQLSMVADAGQQLAAARRYLAEHYPAPETAWAGPRYDHGRIRIGYFSSDLRSHAVAYLTAGLFERHDRSRFETYAFYLGPATDDPWHARLRRAFDHFLDVRTLADGELLALARQHEIDIAVDLNGHTDGCRPGVFARRAAPVQVSYLGFPGTSGTGAMDYLIADEIVIPPQARQHYSEQVVYLPECFQANDAGKEVAADAGPRSDLGLPARGFVFCCFNNSYKITPEVFDIWMRLLRRVEGSVLWLAEAPAGAVANLRREAEARGVAGERLVVAPRRPLAEYLASYRHADLFLDTFCYNAGTTASDALWAGLPVLTLAGNTFARRMAASLLYAVDLPELVAATADAYEQLAHRLATTPALLADVRSTLAVHRTTTPLFDTDRFRRHLESAYLTMWRRQQAGEAPASFRVLPVSPWQGSVAGTQSL